jgi:aspartokinase
VATIAIIGSRLAATPGLSGRMFAALAREGINVDCISSSEMTMSCVIAIDEIDRGVKAVHDEFFATESARRMPAVAKK